MKYIVLLCFMLSSNSLAQCLKSENLNDLKPKVEFTKSVLQPDEMHQSLDEINIELPENYQGLKLHSLRVTKGEVAELYIPLEFKLSNGVAKSYLLGSKSSFNDLELEIVYSNSSCSQFMQTMLLH